MKMLNLLYIITLIIFIDLVICTIYCHIQAAKEPPKNYTSKNSNTISKKEGVLTKIGRFFCIYDLLRYNLFLVSYIPSHTIRNVLYKYIFCVKMGRNSVIHYGTEIRAPYFLEIGNGSIIGDKCILDARYGLKIGENVNFSTGVWIWTLQHGINNEDFSCAGQGAPVTVENRAWLSCRTVILPGVTIKEGAVIAAGAVVTKDVESFSINGGVPAKKIGERNRNVNYVMKSRKCHFI